MDPLANAAAPLTLEIIPRDAEDAIQMMTLDIKKASNAKWKVLPKNPTLTLIDAILDDPTRIEAIAEEVRHHAGSGRTETVRRGLEAIRNYVAGQNRDLIPVSNLRERSGTSYSSYLPKILGKKVGSFEAQNWESALQATELVHLIYDRTAAWIKYETLFPSESAYEVSSLADLDSAFDALKTRVWRVAKCFASRGDVTAIKVGVTTSMAGRTSTYKKSSGFVLAVEIGTCSERPADMSDVAGDSSGASAWPQCLTDAVDGQMLSRMLERLLFKALKERVIHLPDCFDDRGMDKAAGGGKVCDSRNSAAVVYVAFFKQ